MAATLDIANKLVSISLFNKGQASRIFERLQSQDELIVLKNNQPTAYILSPREHERISELEENYYLLIEAYKRLQDNEEQTALTFDHILKKHGILQEELDQMEDVEFE